MSNAVTPPNYEKGSFSGVTEEMRKRWREQRVSLRQAEASIALRVLGISQSIDNDQLTHYIENGGTEDDTILSSDDEFDGGISGQSELNRFTPQWNGVDRGFGNFRTSRYDNPKLSIKRHLTAKRNETEHAPSPAETSAYGKHVHTSNLLQKRPNNTGNVCNMQVNSKPEVNSGVVSGKSILGSSQNRASNSSTITSSSMFPVGSQSGLTAKPIHPRAQSATLPRKHDSSHLLVSNVNKLSCYSKTGIENLAVSRSCITSAGRPQSSIILRSSLTRDKQLQKGRWIRSWSSCIQKKKIDEDDEELEVKIETEYDAKLALEEAITAATRQYFPVKFDARLGGQKSNPREIQQELIALREGKITLDRFPQVNTQPEFSGTTRTPSKAKHISILPKDSDNGVMKPAVYKSKEHEVVGSRGMLFSERTELVLPGYEEKRRLRKAFVGISSDFQEFESSTKQNLSHEVKTLWIRTLVIIRKALVNLPIIKEFVATVHRMGELCDFLRHHTLSQQSQLDDSEVSTNQFQNTISSGKNEVLPSDSIPSIVPRLRQKFLQAWTTDIKGAEIRYLQNSQIEQKESETTSLLAGDEDRTKATLRRMLDFVTSSCDNLLLVTGNVELRREQSPTSSTPRGNTNLEMFKWLATVVAPLLEPSNRAPKQSKTVLVSSQLDWSQIIPSLVRLRNRIRLSLSSRIKREILGLNKMRSPEKMPQLDSASQRTIAEFLKDSELNLCDGKGLALTELPEICFEFQSMHLLLAQLAVVEFMLLSHSITD